MSKIPESKHRAPLVLGDFAVEAHVLDDGRRVISSRSAALALTGKPETSLREIGAMKAVKRNDHAGLILRETVGFRIPGAPDGKGLTAGGFYDICGVVVDAFAAGDIRTPRQMDIARRCASIMKACGKIGLIALIDEATGYQRVRPSNDLQVRLAAYLEEQAGTWEERFPPTFWRALSRLTRSKWSGIGARPKWWGKFIRRFVYDALDPEVASEVKRRNPEPHHGSNHHQFFTDFGERKLRSHLDRVEALMLASSSLDDFAMRFRAAFKGGPLQMDLVN